MRGLKYISWGAAESYGSYAVTAKSYVRGLIDAGVELTWTPVRIGKDGRTERTDSIWPCPKLDKVCNRPLDYDTVLIQTAPEYYPEWIDRERRPGRRIFGSAVWELERLPGHWPAILNRLDGLLVPCGWNAEVFRASGVNIPIHVVPHLSQFVDLPPASGDDRAALHARLGDARSWQDRFIFYTVGFWSNRKAPYLALEAYWRAFDADDPVLMIVKTSSEDITRWGRHWRDAFRLRHPRPERTAAELAARHPRPAASLVIADESLSDAEMLALHEMGDCYVSLARTEGWGLGAFEAARLGKPVITTGYGGQLEFLDPDLAWLVDYEMIPVDEPEWSRNYEPSNRWAAPSVSQAALHMRSVFEDQEAARKRARRLAGKIGREFSGTATIQALLAALA